MLHFASFGGPNGSPFPISDSSPIPISDIATNSTSDHTSDPSAFVTADSRDPRADAPPHGLSDSFANELPVTSAVARADTGTYLQRFSGHLNARVRVQELRPSGRGGAQERCCLDVG